jgi:hypothetical protein
MLKPGIPRLLLNLSFLVLVAFLSGCIKSTPEPSATPAPLPTELPTQTPTTEPARLVLLDESSNAPQVVIDTLAAFAAENALVFEQVNALDPATLSPATRIVVSLTQPANLDALLAAAPQTQFIVAGSLDPAGKANLSVITSKEEDLVFMGGYLTMLIAWDFRAGGLIPTDSALGGNLRIAYENGGRFFCGQCTSYFTPFYYFPLIVEESTSAGAAAWQAQLAPLSEYLVYAAYVDPSAAHVEVLDALAARGISLVGKAGTPNPEYFVALLGADILPGLQQLLPQALAGTSGTAVGSKVSIVTIVDHELVSPGKIDLFNRMAEQVASGYVVPLP